MIGKYAPLMKILRITTAQKLSMVSGITFLITVKLLSKYEIKF